MVSVSQVQRINLSFQRRKNKIHFEDKETGLAVAIHIVTKKDIQMDSHYSKLDGILHRHV